MKIDLYIVIIVFFLICSCNSDDGGSTEPVPPPDYSVDIESCIPSELSSISIGTWNLKEFALRGEETIQKTANIMRELNVDVWAIQEVSIYDHFEKLVSLLDGYEGRIVNVSGGIDLAYIHRSSSFSNVSNQAVLFEEEDFAYPREVVALDFQHSSGFDFTLMNLHMKCCGDGEEKRDSASVILKKYLNENYAEGNVIVAGDFNDILGEGEPFDNFSNDSAYFFADQDIAEGSDQDWSFPSFPSHIDHILCTDDLLDNWQSTFTIKLDLCVSDYRTTISDHRPVVAVFSN